MALQNPAQSLAVCSPTLGDDSELSHHVLITCSMKINETMIFLHDVPCLTFMYLFVNLVGCWMLRCLCALRWIMGEVSGGWSRMHSFKTAAVCGGEG